MTQCPKCEANLIADGLAQGQQVRCVQCATLFRLGEEQKTSADRLAWRSFWLGLSSLVFLFLTGIPAIYYGIRSMLRMRFTKPRPKDQFAAVSGTMMGGCIGVIGGGMILSFAAILAFTLMTVNRPATPEEKLEMYARVFDSDPPALHLDRAVSVLQSQFFFDFYDHEEPDQRTMRLHQIHHRSNFQPMQAQVVAQVSDRSLRIPGHKLVKQDSEILTWKMLDREIEVRKVVFEILPDGETDSTSEPDANVDSQDNGESGVESSPGTAIQYYGICKNPLGYTGMSVIAKQPQPVFTEEKIREMFATIQPVQ